MGHVRFTLHPPSPFDAAAPKAEEAFTGESAGAGRFDTPIGRPLRDEELIYLDGSFTIAELKRLVAWVQGL